MNFNELVERVPVLVPGAALVIGVLLLGWGATLWRFTTIVTGLGLGAWLGLQLGPLTENVNVGLVAAGVLAVGVAVGFYLIERLAFAGLGAVAMLAVLGVVWPLLYPGGEPGVLVELGAGALGLAIGAGLHRRAVQVTAAIAGASVIAWAFKQTGNILIVAPLALVGALFQFGVLRSGGGAKPAKASAKKK